MGTRQAPPFSCVLPWCLSHSYSTYPLTRCLIHDPPPSRFLSRPWQQRWSMVLLFTRVCPKYDFLNACNAVLGMYTFFSWTDWCSSNRPTYEYWRNNPSALSTFVSFVFCFYFILFLFILFLFILFFYYYFYLFFIVTYIYCFSIWYVLFHVLLRSSVRPVTPRLHAYICIYRIYTYASTTRARAHTHARTLARSLIVGGVVTDAGDETRAGVAQHPEGGDREASGRHRIQAGALVKMYQCHHIIMYYDTRTYIDSVIFS